MSLLSVPALSAVYLIPSSVTVAAFPSLPASATNFASVGVITPASLNWFAVVVYVSDSAANALPYAERMN